MLLKTMFRLLPLLLMTDGGNPGGEGESGGGGNETPGGGGQAPPVGDEGGGTPPKPPAEPSANKLIKDFAKDRGLTVEALLSKFTELEEAGQTAAERLERDRDGWKSKYEQTATKLRDMSARSAVADAAREAGALSPNLIYRAIKDDLEYGDDGAPTNVDAVIAALKESEPSQFRAAGGSGDGGRGNGDGAKPIDINDGFRQLGRMAH